MRKADVVAVFGSRTELAKIFAPVNDGKPLTRAAISLWGDEIPELREFQLRKLVPDIDKRIAAAQRRQARAAA